MKIRELMEKLSKMNPGAELVVEGFEDEVETTEEVVDTPTEEVSVWDREVPEDAYADKQSKGYHEIIKTAHKHGIGKTGKIKAPGADKDSPDVGIYYDENNNTETNLKKLKLISKWKWIEAGFPPNFGGHLDDEIELPRFEEYRQKYNAWKEEHGWDQREDLFDERAGIDYTFDDLAEEDNDVEEFDECGSACGKINEEVEKCEKCGKEPCECEKEEEKEVEKTDESVETAESIEARLNEQMKTDYQKDLESISDFLF